jgi:hypothetical protein
MPNTYIADTPGDGALFARGRRLVGLALNAQVHDVVTADGAVVDDNVPGPESYGVPLSRVSCRSPARSYSCCCACLFDFKALLVAVGAGTSLGYLCLGWGRIGHIDVGHGCNVCVWRCLVGRCGGAKEAVVSCRWRLRAALVCVMWQETGGAALCAGCRVLVVM